jgi:multiple sugar transport system permease protein
MSGNVSVRSDRWRHLPAILIAIGFALPLLFMISGSLQRAGAPPPRTPPIVPDPIVTDNYEAAFDLVDLARQLLNSLTVAVIAVPLTLLVASWAGFALTEISRRLARVPIAVSLVALMVPLTALLVGRFALFRVIGLTDTFVPLIAPALIGMSPFYVLLFYWSFRRIPRELFEAARLEGLGPFGQWRRVGMPLVRPMTIAVGVLAFVVTWNNFLDPLIYISDPDLYTVPLGLKQLGELNRSDYPIFLAGAVVATLPVVGAFLYVQRFFLRDFSSQRWFGR